MCSYPSHLTMCLFLQPAAVHADHVPGQDALTKDTGLHIIHATGRSVVMDEETVEEARALALEDAILCGTSGWRKS